MSPIGREIYRRLQEDGRTVKRFEAEAGLSERALLSILQGHSQHPRIDTLQKIASGLGCSVGELLGETPAQPDEIEPFLFDVIRTVLGWGRDRGVIAAEMTDGDIEIIAQALTRSAVRGQGRDSMRAALDDAGENVADLQRYRSAGR